MHDLEEKIIALKKYLRKLLMTINNEASFTLINAKLINKKRIDDILCCIEGTFPEDYKRFIKLGSRQLKSNNYYLQLLQTIRNSFWLNPSLYSVRYGDAERYITAILSSIESDIRFVYSNESGLFK